MKKRSFIKHTILFIRKYSFLIATLIVTISVKAQEVKVKSVVDKNKILIGDYISFKNELIFNPQKFRVQLPVIADTFNRFELVERKVNDTSNQKEQIILTQENIITHFDSGSWFIPSQNIVVTPLDGSASYEIKTDSIPIQVSTIDADTSKPIKPIYEIIAAKKPWWENWLYGGLVLLGLILILGVIYYFYKRNKNKEPKPKEKKIYIAPWDAANDALQKLIDKELWINDQEKQHHTKLTDIIRTYLEDGFGLDCFEKTSQEIITDVKKYLQKKKYKKRSEELDKLRTIFLTADLVKFAKSKPTEQEHQQSNQAAISFVDSTSYFLQKQTIELKNNKV